MDTIINLVWEGPFTLQAIKAKTDHSYDRGIYQIYTHHNVYGRSFVYIGKTDGQTFASRIFQHNWSSGSEPDPDRVEVYLGRLAAPLNDGLGSFEQQIKHIEALLIHAHAPAYNSQSIKEAPGLDAINYRVLNWGAVRSLQREVSGRMWSSAACKWEELKGYQPDQQGPE